MSADSASRLIGQMHLLMGANVDAATGLKFFTKNLYMAQQGYVDQAKAALAAAKAGKDYVPTLNLQQKAFDKLGVSLRDSNGHWLTAENVIDQVRQRMSTMKDATARTALAVQLFGRGGQKLLPWLMQGKQAIADFNAKLRDMGLVWGNKQLTTWASMRKQIFETQMWAKALSITFATVLVPTLLKLMPLVDRLLHSFMRWVPLLPKIMAGLAGFLIVDRVSRLVAGLVSLLSSPAGMWIAGAAAASAAMYELYRHSATVRRAVAEVGQSFKTQLLPALKETAKWLQANVLPVIKQVAAVLKTQLGPLFKDLGKTAASVAKDLGPLFKDLLKDVDLFLAGMKGHWGTVWAALVGPTKIILQQVKTTLQVLVGLTRVALALMRGDWKGAWQIMVQTVKQFVRNIAQLVRMGLREPVKLMKLAWELMKAAVVAGVRTVLRLVAPLGHQIASAVGNLGSTLVHAGLSAISGLLHGISSAWHSVSSWLGGIGGKMRSAIGDLGSILYGAGAAVLEGFYNGLMSVWNKVTGFIGSIGSWISSHKGPLSADLVLLQPHGLALMRGLVVGMTMGAANVAATASRMAGRMAEAVGEPTRALGRVKLPRLKLPDIKAPAIKPSAEVMAKVWRKGLAHHLRVKLAHIEAPKLRPSGTAKGKAWHRELVRELRRDMPVIRLAAIKAPHLRPSGHHIGKAFGVGLAKGLRAEDQSGQEGGRVLGRGSERRRGRWPVRLSEGRYGP